MACVVCVGRGLYNAESCAYMCARVRWGGQAPAHACEGGGEQAGGLGATSVQLSCLGVSIEIVISKPNNL